MPVIHYQHCPVCGGANIKPVLSARDFTVSQQAFSIWECADCTLRFTQDVPDQESIGPFYQSETYISHSDTKKGIVNSAYHLVRRFTLNEKVKLIRRVTGKRSGRILDIGAGTGAFLDQLNKAGWKVTGLEPDAGARSVATEKYGLHLKEPASLFSLEAGAYDAITMWHVLEHVHDLHQYIERIRELLAPGGALILGLPNYQSEDAFIYAENWAAYDVPRHLYHFSPASVKKLLSLHGMSVKSLLPMWFDSFYISLLSEQYKNGKPGYIAAVLNGLRSNKKAFSAPENASSVIYIAGK